MRADSKSSIRNPGPVADIVSAFPSRRGPVGDLVMRVAMRVELRFRKRVKSSKIALFRNPGRKPGPCACLFLVEHVNGNMLGPEFDGAIKIARPGLQLLPRQPRDQVEINVGESLSPQRLEVGEDRRCLMQTPRSYEIFIFQRLSAQADPRDAEISILLNLALGKSS